MKVARRLAGEGKQPKWFMLIKATAQSDTLLTGVTRHRARARARAKAKRQVVGRKLVEVICPGFARHIAWLVAGPENSGA